MCVGLSWGGGVGALRYGTGEESTAPFGSARMCDNMINLKKCGVLFVVPSLHRMIIILYVLAILIAQRTVSAVGMF